MRVLLIEDDAILGDGLRTGLTLEGCHVDWLDNGADAAGALSADSFDVVILDLALPEMSGHEILAGWRRADEAVPVLVLTAHESKANCLDSLNGGADDFVAKPVEIDELLARLRALKRRATGQADNLLEAGALSLDLTARTGHLDTAPLTLSRHEFIVLEALAERHDRPVTRETLESRLYGWDGGPESNALEVLIHKLRGKIGRDRIRTVRGTGWQLATR